MSTDTLSEAGLETAAPSEEPVDQGDYAELIARLLASSNEALHSPTGEWASGAYPTIYDEAALAIKSLQKSEQATFDMAARLLRERDEARTALASPAVAPVAVSVKAKWAGDSDILVSGSEVDVLCIDHNDPSHRRACWIRHWPNARDYPVYRSCDVSDLDIDEAALSSIIPATKGGETECATEGCGKPAVVHFIRGDVGSYYCQDCYRIIHAGEIERLAALSQGTDREVKP